MENFGTDILCTRNMMIIKTTSGNGKSSMINSIKHPSILGVIAGFDTIMVVAVSKKRLRQRTDEFRILTQEFQ